jgi:hypothetical protein
MLKLTQALRSSSLAAAARSGSLTTMTKTMT